MSFVDCRCRVTGTTRGGYGEELLGNGDLVQSTGIGATTAIGPVWQSDYVPCGSGNIFGGGCGGGNFAYFSTNAGQVTANNPAATPIIARTSRSMGVNVSNNLATDIIRWVNVPLVNGRVYRFQMDWAIIFNPAAVALRIDGVIIAPVPAPPAVATWTTREIVFTWTGTTGNHTVSVRSNSGVLAGNDHAFDNFSLTDFTPLEYSLMCDGELIWFDEDGNEVPT